LQQVETPPPGMPARLLYLVKGLRSSGAGARVMRGPFIGGHKTFVCLPDSFSLFTVDSFFKCSAPLTAGVARRDGPPVCFSFLGVPPQKEFRISVLTCRESLCFKSGSFWPLAVIPLSPATFFSRSRVSPCSFVGSRSPPRGKPSPPLSCDFLYRFLISHSLNGRTFFPLLAGNPHRLPSPGYLQGRWFETTFEEILFFFLVPRQSFSCAHQSARFFLLTPTNDSQGGGACTLTVFSFFRKFKKFIQSWGPLSGVLRLPVFDNPPCFSGVGFFLFSEDLRGYVPFVFIFQRLHLF